MPRPVQKQITTPRNALIKLLISMLLLALMILGYFSDIDVDIKGVIGLVAFFLVFPSTILLSIDASRSIKHHHQTSRSVGVIGIVLGIPQAVVGALLIAIGIAYPFFGIHDVVRNIIEGKAALIPLGMTIIAVFMLGLGFYYIREGLCIGNNKNKLDKENG